MPSAEILWQRLAALGTRPAISQEGQRLSGQALLDEVQTRGRHLQDQGVRRVALALDNGIDWLIWDLACLWAGCVCVPLPAFFSEQQQQHLIDSAGIDTLIGQRCSPVVQEGFRHTDSGLSRRPVEQPPELPTGTCKITYTSGTTGTPKGVCLSAETQLTMADSLARVLSPLQLERHLCLLPLAVLLENVAGVYSALLQGSQVEVLPLERVGMNGSSGLDAQRLLKAIDQTRPDSLILLPHLLQVLTQAYQQRPHPESLKFLAVGGGHVSHDLLQRAAALGLPVYEGYGLSECASVVCLNTPGHNRIGSVGRPLPHVRLQIAPSGEVMLQGPRFLGYLGEPAPAASDWLPSGDLGHQDADGFLTLEGRIKNQFITAYGRNVSPEWVEAALDDQPLIQRAWVYGEALPENLAVLVTQAPAEQIAKALESVNAGLPDYARIQRWIRASEPFTPHNGLLTANGRLRRAALLTHYRHRMADACPVGTGESHELL